MENTGSMFEVIKKETDEAIDKSYKGADSMWKNMALNSLLVIATSMEEFTVDDVRKIVLESELQTHDRRAMGGVMIRGKKNGWIVPSGRSLPSRVGHKIPMQIWKSLVFKK